MFNSKNSQGVQSRSFKTGKFINVGQVEAKIVKIEAQKSKAGDKFKVSVGLETKPIQEPDFEGQDGALGQIGKVDFSIYTTGSDGKENDFIDKFSEVANLLGNRAQLDAISANTIEEYLSKVLNVIGGQYLWWSIGGEEYLGTDKDGKPKIKYSLRLPKYAFIAKTEAELLDKQTGKKFPTKEDNWFFKKLAAMDKDELDKEIQDNSNPVDILPF